jgi:hypothetical protein
VNKLEALGISISIGKGCSCSSGLIAYSYTLPIKIDVDLEKFMGKSSTSIEKQGLFKIENEEYSILAVNKLKLIKLSFKKNTNLAFINTFEENLYCYVQNKMKGSL